MRSAWLALSAAVLAAPWLSAAGDAPLLSRFKDLEWMPAASLPPGAEHHLMREDPVTHGVQALVRFPRGYKLPPHTHSTEETLVMLKGRLLVRTDAAEETLGPGDYALIPAKTPHGLEVKGFGQALFIVTTGGPFDFAPARGLR